MANGSTPISPKMRAHRNALYYPTGRKRRNLPRRNGAAFGPKLSGRTERPKFCLSHPRWQSVFQPTHAAYLNRIAPWRKTLRSLAPEGIRFETWEQVEQAIEKATAYWSQHKHPYHWGHRRRPKAKRKTGIGCNAKACLELQNINRMHHLEAFGKPAMRVRQDAWRERTERGTFCASPAHEFCS